MSEMQSNSNPNDFDNEIELREIFSLLWQKKWIIISITTFAAITGVIVSLLLPNIYESKAILSPADSGNSISKSLQNYSGLAGLAGVSIPSGADESNSAKAIQKLNTLSFFENNILPNIFLPDLMALESWDRNTNTLNYDESAYNINTNTWVEIILIPTNKYQVHKKVLKNSKKSTLG